MLTAELAVESDQSKSRQNDWFSDDVCINNVMKSLLYKNKKSLAV